MDFNTSVLQELSQYAQSCEELALTLAAQTQDFCKNVYFIDGIIFFANTSIAFLVYELVCWQMLYFLPDDKIQKTLRIMGWGRIVFASLLGLGYYMALNGVPTWLEWFVW